MTTLTEAEEEARYRFVNRIPADRPLSKFTTGIPGLDASGGVPIPTSVDYDAGFREELKWDGTEWKFVLSDYYPFVTWAVADRPLRNGIAPFDAVRGGLTYRTVPEFHRPTRREIIAARKAKRRDHRRHWFRDWKRARATRRWAKFRDEFPDEFNDWDEDDG